VIHDPGLYFGLDEAAYHADESFSASGVKNMLVSPLTFWKKSNFNPNRKDEETPAMAFGKACDKLIVEGPEAFSMAYAVRPCLADHPEALDGAEDLRARCAELGLKKGGTIAQLCDRILEKDPDAMLWPRIMQQWSDINAGKIAISADWYRDILDRAQLVRNDAEVAKAFSGGYPQVSIFWTAQNGVPMKARVDYLKTKAAIDLKTFSNPFGRPVSEAVAATMGNQKYGVQAVVYLDGIETAKALLRQERMEVHGSVDDGWLNAFMDAPDHRFGFVFVESGDVPNIEGRWFERTRPDGQVTLAYDAAWQRYQWALEQFDHWYRLKGREPWREAAPMRAFEDHEFPMYAVS
jgi:hypothetical protein